MCMFTVTKDGKVYLDGVEKKQSTHSAGYKIVSKNSKLFYVHRLVAQTYIPNPNNLPEVNHINGIKDDNRVENLEWVTNKGNRHHAMNTKLWGKNIVNKRKLTDQQANEIREKYIPRIYSMMRLASEYGVNYKTINHIIHNKSYTKTKESYV